ncbi:hypothetical protein KJZ99_04510 [bacterium]|nr:hypothetical protein [bacterium]
MIQMRAANVVKVMYFAAFLVALLYAIVPRWGEQSDIWETAAAIQAISDSPFQPRNPLLDLPGNTSPRFTPYTVVAGISDRLFDLKLFTTVGIWGLISLGLFISGLARVVRTLTDDRHAMLWVLPVMLLGWGHGYGEANAYQAEHFFLTLPYVGAITYGICFHGLAELNRFLTTGSKLGLIGYTLLACLAFLTHPVTALLLFVAAFAWAIVRKGLAVTALLQIVPVLALGIALLWPYFDYADALFKGSTEQWYKVRLFADQFTKVGPALLGLPVAFYFGLRKRHLELVIALGCSCAIYLLSWLLGIQIGSRFIFYGAIFSHLCIALFFLESGLFRRGFLRLPIVRTGTVIALLVAVIGVGTYYRARKLEMQWTPVIRHYEATQGDILEPWEDLRDFQSYLNSSHVVMVDDTSGWRIPAVTGARLVAQAKGNPLLIDEVNQRRMDVSRFFYESTDTEARQELLHKYHCTHILVDNRLAQKLDHALKSDLEEFADFAIARPPFQLYRVKRLD